MAFAMLVARVHCVRCTARTHTVRGANAEANTVTWVAMYPTEGPTWCHLERDGCASTGRHGKAHQLRQPHTHARATSIAESQNRQRIPDVSKMSSR